ncbi:translation initiation factor IF-2-like [Panicum virgatum]|uniref:translation initiation factor IF-2-like n=1 Tax=Panicum virgatum TaxID=38727 RepID=UPI0019D65F6F|nr:translation initiation factor IF-2-like [Panicum virgatum]
MPPPIPIAPSCCLTGGFKLEVEQLRAAPHVPPAHVGDRAPSRARRSGGRNGLAWPAEAGAAAGGVRASASAPPHSLCSSRSFSLSLSAGTPLTPLPLPLPLRPHPRRPIPSPPWPPSSPPRRGPRGASRVSPRPAAGVALRTTDAGTRRPHAWGEGPLARVAGEEALSRASPWPAHVLGAVKENPTTANSAESDGLSPFAIEEHNKRQLQIYSSVYRSTCTGGGKSGCPMSRGDTRGPKRQQGALAARPTARRECSMRAC